MSREQNVAQMSDDLRDKDTREYLNQPEPEDCPECDNLPEYRTFCKECNGTGRGIMICELCGYNGILENHPCNLSANVQYGIIREMTLVDICRHYAKIIQDNDADIEFRKAESVLKNGLINQQKEEIEKLKAELEKLRSGVIQEMWGKFLEEQALAEIKEPLAKARKTGG